MHARFVCDIVLVIIPRMCTHLHKGPMTQSSHDYSLNPNEKLSFSTQPLIEAETNGRHFPDDIFKCIFLNENVLISIKISLKFVPKGQIINIPSLV